MKWENTCFERVDFGRKLIAIDNVGVVKNFIFNLISIYFL